MRCWKSHFPNISPQNTVKATDALEQWGELTGLVDVWFPPHDPQFQSLREPPGTMPLL